MLLTATCSSLKFTFCHKNCFYIITRLTAIKRVTSTASLDFPRPSAVNSTIMVEEVVVRILENNAAGIFGKEGT